jgi:hypothetical protein
LPVVKNNIPKIIAEVDRAAALAMQDTADFVLNLVRIFAPYRTGELRNSYEVKFNNPLSFIIGTALFRAIYSEYGTSRQRGTPHLTPAAAIGENYFIESFKERLKEV